VILRDVAASRVLIEVVIRDTVAAAVHDERDGSCFPDGDMRKFIVIDSILRWC
jgi:hypothetical protein